MGTSSQCTTFGILGFWRHLGNKTHNHILSITNHLRVMKHVVCWKLLFCSYVHRGWHRNRIPRFMHLYSSKHNISNEKCIVKNFLRFRQFSSSNTFAMSMSVSLIAHQTVQAVRKLDDASVLRLESFYTILRRCVVESLPFSTLVPLKQLAGTGILLGSICV
jgi:hypothetical protein